MSAEPRRAPTLTGERQGRVPDFFIVGHAKSGTTALYEMLRRHPQIYMPESKEPWFFARDMRRRFQPPGSPGAPETLDQYLALFADAGADQLVGEASSSYLWSRTAASAIAKARPDARVIAILREPASFLRSLHLQLLQTHVEVERDLRRAIALEAARRRGRHVPRRSPRPQLLQYSDHVRYSEQLRRYHELFGRDQVLVLIYDDFRRDNEQVVRRVLRFLEVDESHPIELVDANPTILIRSQQLDDLVHAVSVGRGNYSRVAKGTLKALAPRVLRRGILRLAQRRVVYGKAPPPDPQLMLELRRRFKSEVVALSEYMGRDLVSLWGYEDVAC
ncbi:MAG: sulfotransferase [Actinobacteria bacterium]|nr:MAG: sulfotransferase [Actinomycetota bacterium]